MKHELKRVKETVFSVGDVKLDTPVGEKVLLSSRETEVALSTGDYEYIREFKDYSLEELKEKTIPDLKKIAAEREVDLTGKTLKNDIIEKILNPDDETESGGENDDEQNGDESNSDADKSGDISDKSDDKSETEGGNE